MSDTPPAGLCSAVIERALERRVAGRPVGAAAPCSALEAFRRAIVQLHDVLALLGPDDWRAAAHRDIGDVRDVVAHLVGVERLALDWLSRPDGMWADPSEHLSAAGAAIDDLADRTPEEITTIWFEAALAVHDACAAADPTKVVLAHDLPTDVDGLLLLRAFELWAHLQDVCTATGRPRPEVDEERLALMSSRLMGAVPVALLLRAVSVDLAAVRFVLTGVAGGCYDVVLSADAPSHAETTIVVDTLDVCRVAARRLDVADLEVTVDGAAAPARTVLAALDAFARD